MMTMKNGPRLTSWLAASTNLSNGSRPSSFLRSSAASVLSTPPP